MARLPEYKRLVVEDYPKEERPWLGKLFVPVNRFMLSVYQALNRQLTINDNFLGEIKRNVLVSADAFPVSTGGGVKFRYALFEKFGSATPQPLSVIIGRIQENISTPPTFTNAVTCDWDYSEGTIRIKNITGLTSGKNYLVTFEVKSG